MATETIGTATFTAKELCAFLGISKGLAYEYLFNGTIPARRLGRKWIISRAVVEDWLANKQ